MPLVIHRLTLRESPLSLCCSEQPRSQRSPGYLLTISRSSKCHSLRQIHGLKSSGLHEGWKAVELTHQFMLGSLPGRWKGLLLWWRRSPVRKANQCWLKQAVHFSSIRTLIFIPHLRCWWHLSMSTSGRWGHAGHKLLGGRSPCWVEWPLRLLPDTGWRHPDHLVLGRLKIHIHLPKTLNCELPAW